MKPINNLALRKRLKEIVTDRCENTHSPELINDFVMWLEVGVLTWVAEEGLKKDDAKKDSELKAEFEDEYPLKKCIHCGNNYCTCWL